jgi:hypothetical protein
MAIATALRHATLTPMTEIGVTPGLAPRCARHGDAAAEGLCSRCGDQLCRACLPIESRSCAPCAERDPFYGVAQLPWEQAEVPRAGRVLATLGALLLRPSSRATAFARGEVRPALDFAVRVALPLACISHVVPVTRTLLFGPNMALQRLGNATAAEIALDVVRAMVFGVLVMPLSTGFAFALVLLASGLRDARLWLRHALYWAWLSPALAASSSLVAWIAPADSILSGLSPLVALPILWWFSLLFVARRARRASWPWAIFIALCGGFGWQLGAGATSALTLRMGLVAAQAPQAAP